MPLERIPPVRARFPLREVRRADGLSLARPGPDPGAPPGRGGEEAAAAAPRRAREDRADREPSGEKPFRVDKRGWEDDYFDRRGIRNLIRTGEILETDHVFAPDGSWVVAGEVPS